MTDLLVELLLVAARVLPFALLTPVLMGQRGLRAGAVALAIALAGLFVAVGVPVHAAPQPLAALRELALGFSLALAVFLVFEAAQWAGELMRIQLALSRESTLPGFTQALATFLYLVSGAHWLLLDAIGNTFALVPAGAPVPADTWSELVGWGLTWTQASFELALALAAPVLVLAVLVAVAGACIERVTSVWATVALRLPLNVLIAAASLAAGAALMIDSWLLSAEAASLVSQAFGGRP